jgi:hypothetical protein
MRGGSLLQVRLGHKGRSSFLKKRTKKLLLPGTRQDTGPGRQREAAEEVKVFCFFFSKKKAFFLSS